MPNFFAERVDDRVEIRGRDARHLAGPLRARPGELIQVVEAGGRLLTVELQVVGSALVSGRVVEEVPYDPEPRTQVLIGVAMLPAASLDLVLSRCTEAGAAGFLLIEAEHSVARGARPERWATICREAAMLAGRLRVPEVAGPVSLAEACRAHGDAWMLDRSAPAPLTAQRLEATATLLIGPEGGWTPQELSLCGDRVASLGPRNLRADTAAVVALTQALRGS